MEKDDIIYYFIKSISKRFRYPKCEGSENITHYNIVFFFYLKCIIYIKITLNYEQYYSH